MIYEADISICVSAQFVLDPGLPNYVSKSVRYAGEEFYASATESRSDQPLLVCSVASPSLTLRINQSSARQRDAQCLNTLFHCQHTLFTSTGTFTAALRDLHQYGCSSCTHCRNNSWYEKGAQKERFMYVSGYSVIDVPLHHLHLTSM